jgi:uncharacterized membrane protein
MIRLLIPQERDLMPPMKLTVALLLAAPLAVVVGTVAARVELIHSATSGTAPMLVFDAGCVVGALLLVAGLVRWHRAAYR